jgi:capsular exopolysaccharide synthesis family protein
VVQSLLSQRLVVEREISNLSADMRASHPEYQAKQGDLRVIEERLQEQYDRILEKLHSEYELAKSNEAYLDEQIAETEQQAYRLRKDTSDYELDTSATASKRRVYDVVAETMERLTVGAQLIEMNNNVAVLEEAVVPRYPVYPRKRLSVAFGGMIGLLLGVGAVLFLDYLDNTIRTPEEVEQYLGLNLLGIIPKARPGDEKAEREAFQSLRTSVIFSSHNRERNVLLLTSAGPQEGKSSTTARLARALASAGDRVLVVDCDLRRPTQHTQLRVDREPGITNYLLEADPVSVEPFTQTAEPASLSVLASGPIPPNPPDLIGQTRFRQLIGELKHGYDWVLIDSPPVASLADSVLLASMVDMMILVIKHNENERDLIRSSLNRLREADVHVAGAVLNGVDLGRSDYGYYYYTSDEERESRRSGGARGRSKRAG